MTTLCWYCGSKDATSERYGKTICKVCDDQDFRAILPPEERTDEDKAMLWKLMITMFEVGKEQDKEDE